MAQAVKTIRAIAFEDDAASDVRSIADIREFDAAVAEAPAMSFTAISKNLDRAS